MRLGARSAKAEIKRLMRGEDGKHVPGGCWSCFACDAACPKGANPHSLMLRNWSARIGTRGVPFAARLSLPLEPPPPVRSAARKRNSPA
ncbi:MAG: hypothetical protein AB1742_07190, partial [bacterium]